MEKIDFRYDPDIVTSHRLFKGLSPAFIQSLTKHQEAFSIEYKDEITVEQSSEMNESEIWIILSGEIRVTFKNDAGQIVERKLSAGDHFATLRALIGSEGKCHVKAEKNTYLIKIPVQFKDFSTEPEISVLLRRIIQAFCEYRTYQRKKSAGQCIACIPANGCFAETTQFFIELGVPSFKKLGKTLVISERNYKEVLGIADTEKLTVEELIFKLISVEDDYPYLVVLPSENDDLWTKACLLRSNRVLYFINSSQSVSLTLLGEKCLEIVLEKGVSVNSKIVFCHKDKQHVDPSLREWKKKLQVQRQYHVVPDDPNDVARLVRVLTNQSVGLVLGSGAGRGINHVGIYRALIEAGIPIDIVGGTSVGSILGSLVARQIPWEECASSIEEFLRSLGSLEYSFPVLSLLSREAFENLTRPFVTDGYIEDYHLNYFCVALSLVNTSVVIHESGKAVDAINSSCALPGIFPPVEMNGDILVDGGAIDPVPVEPMIDLYQPGYIIAVDVTSETLIKSEENQKVESQTFFDKLFSSKPKPSYSLPQVIMSLCETSGTINRKKIIEENLSDQYLTPPLEDIPMIPNPENVSDFIERSYRQYKDQAVQWRQEIEGKNPLI